MTSAPATGARNQHRPAFIAVMTLVSVALGTSGAPAALYGTYAEKWHFEEITTTVIFSVYAGAALIAVLVTGSISDRYGRRPVLISAIVLILAGLVLFMTASGVGALLVARTLHGLGIGATVVASSAALLDLRPDDGARTGRTTGVSFNFGIAVIVIATGWLVDHGPRPLVTPFAVLTAIFVVLLIAVVVMPEPHATDRATSLHVARPQVPPSIRASFRFSVLGAMAAWSVLGVFLSLYPTIASRSIGADNVLFGAAVVGISAAAGGVAMAITGTWDAKRTAIAGDFGTAAFLLLAIPAVHSGHAWAVVADATALGAFFGMAFGSSLRHLMERVPPEHRGEVMSAFYVMAYSAMALPTIFVGWAATQWSAEDIFGPFMALVATACVTAGWLGLRSGEDE